MYPSVPVTRTRTGSGSQPELTPGRTVTHELAHRHDPKAARLAPRLAAAADVGDLGLAAVPMVAVIAPVQCDLVTRVHERAHEIGAILGLVGQHEERPAGAAGLERRRDRGRAVGVGAVVVR